MCMGQYGVWEASSDERQSEANTKITGRKKSVNVFAKEETKRVWGATRKSDLTWVGHFQRIVWDKGGKGSWDMGKPFNKCKDKELEFMLVSSWKVFKILGKKTEQYELCSRLTYLPIINRIKWLKDRKIDPKSVEIKRGVWGNICMIKIRKEIWLFGACLHWWAC